MQDRLVSMQDGDRDAFDPLGGGEGANLATCDLEVRSRIPRMSDRVRSGGALKPRPRRLGLTGGGK